MSECGSHGFSEWLALGRPDWAPRSAGAEFPGWLGCRGEMKRKKQAQEGLRAQVRDRNGFTEAQTGFPERTGQQAAVRTAELNLRVEKAAWGLKAAKPPVASLPTPSALFCAKYTAETRQGDPGTGGAAGPPGRGRGGVVPGQQRHGLLPLPRIPT